MGWSLHEVFILHHASDLVSDGALEHYPCFLARSSETLAAVDQARVRNLLTFRGEVSRRVASWSKLLPFIFIAVSGQMPTLLSHLLLLRVNTEPLIDTITFTRLRLRPLADTGMVFVSTISIGLHNRFWITGIEKWKMCSVTIPDSECTCYWRLYYEICVGLVS